MFFIRKSMFLSSMARNCMGGAHLEIPKLGKDGEEERRVLIALS